MLPQTRSLGMTRQLGQAISLLKFSNQELASFIAFQEAINPYLSLQSAAIPPERPAETGAPWQTGSSTQGSVERIAGPAAGLHEHARREISLALKSTADLRIAEFFVEALEPTGWLGRSVEEIAADAQCDIAEAEAVLARIQRIDPPGLFARSLAECLRLQAEDAGTLTLQLSCVLENLPMLARGDIDALAELCGCSRKDVLAHFDTIRGLNPKPGTAFDTDAPRDAPPDLVVTEQGRAWEVELNRSTLPTLAVNEASGLSETDRRMFEAAHTVVRAVERRNYTTLMIATEVVRRQSAFLREGPAGLKPLSFRDIAEAVGVHESTVSRVTAGLRVAAPRGPLALRDFFSTALPTRSDDDPVSAAAVRARIAELIEAEDPLRPMTDSAIAAHFSDRGILVARRTVAKYRDAMKIAGSADRRRRAILRRK
ncbi:RNA polymerase factor sigma-54 [Ostreiculturibacter nitratireducens]|uniref:RNA polymerase factor sigma-54 n=1 Tax=Ostreiculturibacter nitratireducens TaxID=3075226 RepID=UPI0031B57CA5